MKIRHVVALQGKAIALLAVLLLACTVAIPLLSGCAEEEEEASPTPGGTPAATVTGSAAPEGTPTTAVAEGPGITDTEIILGADCILSGAFGAVYAMIPQTIEAAQDAISDISEAAKD